MIFRTKNMKVDFDKVALKLEGKDVERIGEDCETKYFKFVGIHLDEYLSWEYQINHIHSKLSSGNFAIVQSKNFLPIKIRKTLYNSLFKSHLDYGILGWGNVSSGKLKRLRQIQKKCIRNVAGKNYRSHTDPIFSSLGLLKFDDLITYNSNTFMHKNIMGKLPVSFDDNFLCPLAPPNRTKGFRENNTRIKFLEQFQSYFLPKIWNNNSLFLKLIQSHKSFKKECFESLIKSYASHVRCDDYMCQDCFRQR